nr:unnamed protein product [Spirometra erinaceieuropaei]
MLWASPHLGDGEAMVGPPVGIRHCLCHLHVLSVSLPDEDIVRQVPVWRARMHPGGLLLRRKEEKGVGEDEEDWSSGSVDADDGGEFASPKRLAETHRTITVALRQTGQSAHDVLPEGKGDVRVLSFCPGAAAPEEGVAGNHLLQLALVGEPGLAMPTL